MQYGSTAFMGQKFKVLIVVSLRIQIFWDVMLHPWVRGSWYFEGL